MSQVFNYKNTWSYNIHTLFFRIFIKFRQGFLAEFRRVRRSVSQRNSCVNLLTNNQMRRCGEPNSTSIIYAPHLPFRKPVILTAGRVFRPERKDLCAQLCCTFLSDDRWVNFFFSKGRRDFSARRKPLKRKA